MTSVSAVNNSRLIVRDVSLLGGNERMSIVCEGGRIRDVGTIEVSDLTNGTVVDGLGGKVLPLFVDVHSHADSRAWDPRLSEPKFRQGIGTEIVGNCGIGPAPVASHDPAWEAVLQGVAMGFPGDWENKTFAEYLSVLTSANANAWPRVFSLLPYTAARVAVAGWTRELSRDQTARVQTEVDRALDSGAVGVSLGLVYPPSDAATFAELAVTLRPLASHRRPLTTHIRSQANWWLEAIDEVIRLAAQLNIRLIISHLCVGGQRNQWKVDWVLSRLSEARRQGIDVWFDQHPYAAGQTSLTQLIPPWLVSATPRGVELGTDIATLRETLARPSPAPGWENYIELIGASQILVAADNFPDFNGRRLSEIGADLHLDDAETLSHLIGATGGNASIILLDLYTEAAITAIAREPFGCISTDGVHTHLPHPRLYGTYPYAFSRFVRSGRMTINEFVDRTSRRPFAMFGLPFTASLDVGDRADFVVIDPNLFDHRADYLQPWQEVSGLVHIIGDGRLLL